MSDDPWAEVIATTSPALEPGPMADLEGNTCHCWSRDCDECGRKLADGKRPRPGEVRRAALQADASLQAAKDEWHRRCLEVTP